MHTTGATASMRPAIRLPNQAASVVAASAMKAPAVRGSSSSS
jgi:hypothetical protein